MTISERARRLKETRCDCTWNGSRWFIVRENWRNKHFFERKKLQGVITYDMYSSWRARSWWKLISFAVAIRSITKRCPQSRFVATCNRLLQNLAQDLNLKVPTKSEPKTELETLSNVLRALVRSLLSRSSWVQWLDRLFYQHRGFSLKQKLISEFRLLDISCLGLLNPPPFYSF